MGKFYVQEPLQHDGESYPIGSIANLPDKVAEGLIALGVLLDQGASKDKAKADAEAAAKADAEAKALAEEVARAEAETAAKAEEEAKAQAEAAAKAGQE